MLSNVLRGTLTRCTAFKQQQKQPQLGGVLSLRGNTPMQMTLCLNTINITSTQPVHNIRFLHLSHRKHTFTSERNDQKLSSQSSDNRHQNKVVKIARCVYFYRANNNNNNNIYHNNYNSNINDKQLKQQITSHEENKQPEIGYDNKATQAKSTFDQTLFLAKKKSLDNNNNSDRQQDKRRLVLLISWLQARDKHVNKFAKIYTDRGFDVLSVKTPVIDLLWPRNSMKTSSECVKFLLKHQYDDVLYHGFSVAGFVMCNIAKYVRENLSPNERSKLESSSRGIVFDCLVTQGYASKGVASSLTSTKLASLILEKLITFYLILAYPFATRHYLSANKILEGGALLCPHLLISSTSDKVIDHKELDKLVEVWNRVGIETQRWIVDDSSHVSIYRDHKETYEKVLEQFMKYIRLT